MEKKYQIKTLFLAVILISAIPSFAQIDTITIPNHSFENWTCPSYCDPTNWMSDNTFTYLGGLGPIEVSKATAAAHVHGGSYSAKLQTQSIIGNIAPGTITTGVINRTTQAINGGCAINYKPFKFKGWFQYAPSGVDTFVVNFALYAGNTYTTQPIGTANFVTTSTVSNWTQFSLPITYTGLGTPDTMQIIISSGTGNNSHSGTIAYVDDLSLIDCSGMAVSATPTDATCIQSDGIAVATASGGSGPYTYVWSNNATTATISNLVPAAYTVVATDTNGCTAQGGAAIVASNVAFTVGLTPVAASCSTATGSITASASAGNSPYTYLWANSSTATQLTNLSAANYSVTVTDAHGCTTSATTSVTSVNVPFTVTPTNGTTACASNTGTVSVAASAGASPYTYLWSNSSTSAQLTGLGTGSYSVTVTDAHVCTTTASASVSTLNGPSATDTVTNLNCHNDASGAVTVHETGGTSPFTYAWSNAATTANLSNLAAGTYILTITDHSSCVFNLSITVTQPDTIHATDSTTNVGCHGDLTGGVIVTATGGTMPYNYHWNNSATTLNLTHVGSGNYTLTISDHNNCSFLVSAIISQPTALLVTDTAANVSCHGASTGTAMVFASGGVSPYSYSWTGGATTTNIASLGAGTYSVVVTDFNHCSVSSGLTINQPAALIASVSVTNASSLNGTDGSAFVTATGGVSAYSYSWATGSGHDTITQLSPATYCVTVTDANHCTASACDSVGYSVGINTISSVLIKIYPNPASGQLSIETNSADGKFQFTLYSLDGKLVEQKSIAGEKNTIQLNQLADGLYTYQLKDIISGNLNYGKLQIQR